MQNNGTGINDNAVLSILRINGIPITILLTLIRFSNIFTTSKRQEAFTEALGRTMGWWVNKPKIMN